MVMKKPRKPMESPSIRCYEQRMRKNLLNNLAWILSFLFIGAAVPVSAGTAAFLIFHDGIDISGEAGRLEQNGARVRQRIPPNILVVDLPTTIVPNKIPGTKTAFTTAIALKTLEPYGPVAVAAGMQWNRSALRSAHATGQSLGAMRVLVSQKSLPAPAAPTIALLGAAGIRAEWPAIDGAIYYEVEVALNGSFNQPFCVTRTNRPSADLPLPEGNGPKTVFARVRGVDAIDAENGTKEEVMGAWSRTGSLGVTATPIDTSLNVPALTSPNPDYNSAGFTLILEWTGNTAPDARIQIARTTNFQTALIDAVVANAEYVVPSPGLKVGDTLYWRVKAWGPQKSEWTPSRSIRIGSPRNEHIDMFVNPEAPQ
jgi:hypothetical protein